MEMNFEVLRMVVSLGVVLGVLGLTAYGVQRMRRWTRRSGVDNWIEILGQHAVGVKHYLLLVRVRDQLFFLGVSPQGIHLLSELREGSEGPSSAHNPG
jgi:flagellar biogenesis protein FliO